jgi:hypothetical protein
MSRAPFGYSFLFAPSYSWSKRLQPITKWRNEAPIGMHQYPLEKQSYQKWCVAKVVTISEEPAITANQLGHYRNYIELLFEQPTW